MSRLPQPGQDSGQWGDVLNDFLVQAHNVNGTLKAGSIDTSNIVDASITAAKLAPNTISTAGVSGSYADLTNKPSIPTTPSQVGAEPVGLSTATKSSLDATYAHAADLAAKAPLASPAFTGTPTGITKVHVGLNNVDNTTDLSKPISTDTQTALNLKAPLASPAFTGTPTGITKAHVGLTNVQNVGVYTLGLNDPATGIPAGSIILRGPIV